MKLPHRRNFLHLAAVAAALPALSRVAWAQTYPARPVRWIVPFAAGGGNDIAARLIGQWLSERLAQPFVIDNRPGAGGNIATEAAVRAPADGYLPGFEASAWSVFGVPKNTPSEIVNKLNKEINAGLSDPKIKARFADVGATALLGSPADFGKLIADDTEKWGKVIRAANIKPE
jgi:tripartite-type tricarboxylate transporter receptor subunit TctC